MTEDTSRQKRHISIKANFMVALERYISISNANMFYQQVWNVLIFLT